MERLMNVGSFVAGFGLVALLAYLLPSWNHPGVKQPLPFNHAKHVKAGWKCANCHPFTDQQAFAGIPRAQDCVDCHENDMPKHPDNKKMRKATEQLRKLVAQGEDLPWVQVHRTKAHVYYSHRRHAELGKLECQTCHGKVEKMTAPFTKPGFPVQQGWVAYDYSVRKMNWCMDCHRQKKVTTDCLACHR